MIIVKIGFLFLAVLFSLVNGYRLILKSETPGLNFILQGAGITGFVTCQWLL